MKTKNIHQIVVIPASTAQVYEALMDSKKHSKFTCEKAKIEKKAGGKFSCYDSYITGINLDLKPAQHIVQAWRSQDWPQGYHSVVMFKLTKAGPKKSKLEFTQIGVPADDFKAKSSGWKEHYWIPLTAMFEEVE